MKVKVFYIFFIVLSIATGCKMNSDRNNIVLPIFDLGATIDKHVPDTFTWNGIAKKITYIPVSTSWDKLFRSAKPIYIDDEFYYMLDFKESTVICADKKGKIINTITKKGKGPGEYISPDYVYVNPMDSTIQIFDRRGDKCVIYDLAGNLIQDISLKNTEISLPVFISDNYIVARTRDDSDSAYKLYITDKKMNIKQRLFSMDTTLTEAERLQLIWQLNYCANRDLSIVNFANEDTVFTITEKGAQPLCVFKKGEYRLPDEMAKKPMEFTEQGSPYFRSMRISSIPGYYLISYLFKGHYYDEVWNKTNRQVISRFVIDGEVGLPFLLPSGKTIRINGSSLFIEDNIVAFYIPAAIAAEEKLADVDEDDNPVLVVLTL